MDSLWISVIALGIAGLDPVGALLGVGALANGTRRVPVIMYGLAIIVATVATGTVLSLTAASLSFNIDWSFTMIPDPVWSIGQLAVGVALLWLGFRRWNARNDEEESEPKRSRGPIALIGLGLLLGVTAPTDPTFLAVTVLAGKSEDVLAIVAAHSFWILISQLPLTVLVVALVFNKHHAVVQRIQTGWKRVRPYFTHTITALVSVIGIVLLVDVGWWIISGQWMLLF